MTITKSVDLGYHEVEIQIGAEDVQQALSVELADAEEKKEISVRRALNSIAVFLNALSEDQIKAQSPAVRELVSEFLTKHAKRFKVDVQ